jgi:ribosome-binding protein aMBF1 (putative translation factor)
MGPNRRAQERERAAARAAARAKRAEAERKAVAEGLHLRMALASNVRRIRQAQGLTQVGFAHEAGMDRSCVSRLENGNFDVWMNTLARVAAALGVEPSELLQMHKPRGKWRRPRPSAAARSQA